MLHLLHHRKLSEYRCSSSCHIRRVINSKFNCGAGAGGPKYPPADYYKDYSFIKRLFSIAFGSLPGVYHHTPSGSTYIKTALCWFFIIFTEEKEDYVVVAGSTRSDYIFIRKCVEFMCKGMQFNSLNPECIREFNEALADVNGLYPFPDPAWEAAMLLEGDMCEDVSNEVNTSLLRRKSRIEGGE